jgi:hypothetical protein
LVAERKGEKKVRKELRKEGRTVRMKEEVKDGGREEV